MTTNQKEKYIYGGIYMTNTIFTYKNPNPPTIEPAPDPNKPRYLKAVVNEDDTHESKRFVLIRNEAETEPVRRFVLEQQGE